MKKKLGRPRKAPEDKRSDIVMIRLTPSERRLLNKSRGTLPIGTYMRVKSLT